MTALHRGRVESVTIGGTRYDVNFDDDGELYRMDVSPPPRPMMSRSACITIPLLQSDPEETIAFLEALQRYAARREAHAAKWRRAQRARALRRQQHQHRKVCR